MLRVDVLDRDGETVATAEAPAAERLVDVLDELRAPVSFGCRSATCGICLLEVVEGAELLAPPDAIERVALEDLGAAPGDRLGCRAAAASRDGIVRLRPRAPRR